MHTIEIATLAEIGKSAQLFKERIGSSKILAFRGEMGAGKTTFIKAFCKVLGTEDTVTSPTFALVNEYEMADSSIYHFDFYRIDEVEEAVNIGFDEYLYSGDFCLIEWAEKVESLLPEETLYVDIKINKDGSRTLVI